MISCQECEVFRNGTLGGTLQEKELERMNIQRRNFTMRKNQILFTVGQPLNGWYCVKRGRIRLYKVSSGGKEQTYDIAGAGDWIGHREMVENGDSHASAVSLEESEVCFVPRSVWSTLMENRSFVQSLMERLVYQLRRAEDTIFALGTKKLHARLAELLIELSERDAHKTISLTRELMSTMVGSSTETIVRALTDFKDRKWVLVNRNSITVLNAAALKEMAQMDHF